MSDLPGVDVPALTRWLDEQHPGLRQGELTGEVVAGGKSNLTYRITDGTSTWAMRRPPLAHVLPTAHDMVREFRVINALAPTEVPVPQAVALCDDKDVIGASFYLMGFVDGVVLDKPDLLAELDPADAKHCCELLMDTLVTLHEVDPAAVGLAEFGRPEGFLARQLKRWHGQWQASETEPREELGRLVERLGATMPEQSAPAIVHGDYRLTNVMFAPGLDRIAAVVDWEMATLGDPLTDVGLLVVYQSLSASDDLVMPMMKPERGFLTADAMVERYARSSPRDLGDLDWYVAFGYFKLAVVSEGIHNRYLAGKTVGAGFDHFGRSVPLLLGYALDRLSGR
ncbi:MAG TPA: phosphotransferase family protein [Jatrophihabitans sp.]|uniref:phosphotransferase family protein n=1 Tax=Jatrophihabitans sp. TaxID=1932789 RepID=UPI002E010D64|nr:phosphotransferase family protein [Jatrophihabitans sp.]